MELPARAQRRSADWAALALSLGGLAAAMLLIRFSDGYYQDDDIGHFLFSRAGWGDAKSLWHVWARPGYALPATVVAHFFGMLGCRIFSALQTAMTAWLAYRIARRISPRAVWPVAMAPALVWVQPLAMTLACTTLTETTAALYLTLGVWLYLRGNRVRACAVCSLLFVTRYETLGLGLVLGAAVAIDALKQARWKLTRAARLRWPWMCAISLLWAPAAYAAVAIAIELPAKASPLLMFWESYSYKDQYGRGRWMHFVYNWLMAGGVAAAGLAAAGALLAWRRAWLPAALTAGLVVLHTVIYHYGLAASGGYARFLVPVCGLVAALAAVALARSWQSRRRREVALVLASLSGAAALAGWGAWNFLLGLQAWVVTVSAAIAAAAALVCSDRLGRLLGRLAVPAALALAAWQAGQVIRPLRLDLTSDDHRFVVVEAVRAVEQTEHAGNDALTCHVFASLIRDGTTVVYSRADAIRQWQAAGAGTLFFWENKYGGAGGDADGLHEDRLYRTLKKLGQSVRRFSRGEARGEVFIRRSNTTAHEARGVNQ